MSLGLAVGACLLVTALGAGQESAPRWTVIVGATLIDGTGAPPRANVDIEIDGDRIASISPSGSRPAPEGAARVEARGLYVLPGLIDSHVHYQAWMGELFLHHGVTTVFDLGNELKIFDVRDGLRSGRLAGPRLYVAGQGLQGVSPANGSGATNARRTTIRTLEDARRTALAMLDRGADVVKVREWIPADWMRAVVEVAHARRKPVVGHLTIPTHEALEAGVDSVTHAYGIDLSTLADPAKLEAGRRAAPLTAARTDFYPLDLLEPARYGPLVDLFARRKAVFNPAFGSQFRGVLPEGAEFERYDAAFLRSRTADLGSLAAALEPRLLPYFTRTNLDYIGNPARPLDAVQREKLEIGMRNVAEFMRQLIRAGGRMVAGSDTSQGTGGIPGLRLQHELQLWVSQGLDRMETIRSATQYPAQLLHLPDLGTVEVGKKADLLLLKANPLEDLRSLRAIERVYLDGRPLRRELDPAPFRPLVDRK